MVDRAQCAAAPYNHYQTILMMEQIWAAEAVQEVPAQVEQEVAGKR
jgi:hypothetical protein